MKQINPQIIYSFKDSVILTNEEENKFNAINSLFLSIGGNKKKFKNMKDMTPKTNKTNIWKNIIEKQKSDSDINIKLLVNFWLNKLSTDNTELILVNLSKLPFNNSEQTLIIFENLLDKILNDINYYHCYVELLIEISKKIELNFNFIELLINCLEENYFNETKMENVIKVISILNKKQILSNELVKSMVHDFLNKNNGNYLYILLNCYKNNINLFDSYKNEIKTKSDNFDTRTKILINNLLDNKSNTIEQQKPQINDSNKDEIACINILNEYLEIEDIHEVIEYYERKLKSKKIIFCKIILKYWLTKIDFDKIKNLLTTFLKSNLFNKNDIITSWNFINQELEDLKLDYSLVNQNLPKVNSFIKNFSNTSH